MRVFETLREAALEIRRDLAKSPKVESSRVQNLESKGNVHEALGYNYTIIEVPSTIGELVSVGVETGLLPNSYTFLDPYADWLQAEMLARVVARPGIITEKLHPQLSGLLEGSEPSYSYADRLHSSVETVASLLMNFPDTRRGFWPIFRHEDAMRMQRMTRIPCSLGYEVLIRKVGDQRKLHMVYVQRSCDFKRFWLSDVFLARYWQSAVHDWMLYSPNFEDLKLGRFSHYIISFHEFEDEEIY